jgi:hypothetical protein
MFENWKQMANKNQSTKSIKQTKQVSKPQETQLMYR